ncbi:MAG: serine hydrolase [Actinophytocola sp.]|uniref:serine hydrolase domain-containing protein n=1 Tax=Actinophytocola sp. TaxID=1872138 RepID=UPI003C73365A
MGWRVPVCLGVLLVFVGGCTAAPPPPSPAETPALPSGGWPVGEWPDGVDRAEVDKAVDDAFAAGGPLRVRAIVVVRQGKLVYQRYSPNPADAQDAQMPSYSVAKSITSAAAGLLVRDGKFDVRAPVRAPEWPQGDPRAAITADHLLRMSSGLRWNEDTDIGAATSGRDAAAFSARQPLATPPGTTFLYSTGSTFIVARALQDAVGGGGAGLRDYLERELFDPLGMAVTLSFDDAGNWLGGYGAAATPLDYAKFGELYRLGGEWRGTRILPADWVEYSREPSTTSEQYGAGWWLDPDSPQTFAAIGFDGQQVVVEHDLVVVITATDPERSETLREKVVTEFAR